MKWLATRLIFLLILSAPVLMSQNQGYYRFPAIHEKTIIFTAEGDLWSVGTDGGVARRLTSNHGVEAYAAISPDGSTIAFCAEYEGPTEVYTMPIGGGVPVRRTYAGATRVVGWTPDGKILYATMRYSTLPNVQIAELDPTNGESTLIKLAQASDGSFDQTGTTFYFTRFAFQGSHTKRYKGGTAQNIWKYKDGEKEATLLTGDFEGTSKTPLWFNRKIYFASDRDGTMNLWSMSTDGSDLKQLTTHKGWDIKSPSIGTGQIVYQVGADIFLYDIASGSDKLVPITLSSDFDQLRVKWVKNPMEYLSSFSVSPNGDRLALTARGQVFVAPFERGRFVRATDNDTVRYRSATFMPDGKSILAFSDQTGETEFWTVPANGVGTQKQLTRGATVLRWGGIPSPDGKWIAYTDKNEEIWVVDLQKNETHRVYKTEEGGPDNLAWSPDSKWLAYSHAAKNTFNQIALYNVTTARTIEITSDRVDSENPAWSPDGKWLYFISDRVFQSVVPSPWGPREPEPYFEKTRNIYALALRNDLRFPFQSNDELYKPESEEKNSGKKPTPKDTASKSIEIKIDETGLMTRTYEVPIPTSVYTDLQVNDKFIFCVERHSFYEGKSNLIALEIKNKDIAAKTVLEDIAGYELSADGKKLAVRKGPDFYIFDANGLPPGDLAKVKVNLANWTFTVDPREEFRQMFKESWRLERDYFYDPSMHGIDYQALLKRHLPLVDRVTDRDELSDLMTDLVGELSALHTFVYGGDVRRTTADVSNGSLGAMISFDAKNGFVIGHIYQNDPNYPASASPLAQVGSSVREGDQILSVNGTTCTPTNPPEALLKNQAGQQVLLELRSASTGKNYELIVKPISLADESNLRYSEWEITRRTRVDELSKNEIGYVHLRAMGGGNYGEWAKNFYPVFERKGLIVDVRHNNGGNIDSWILEKLLRKAWFYWQGRVGRPSWNMQYAFRGPMVVLCDERTASDGEAFTEGFRRLGLGKVIGTRTWGGEIWLSSSNVLVDHGIATAAESGVFGPEGKWLIEGRGVEPDIVIDNKPHSAFNGVDAQLEAAVSYLQQQIREHPVEPPIAPKYPNKSFRY